MLREFVKQMCSDLEIDADLTMDKEKTIEISLNPDVKIHFKELDPGIALQTMISPCPEERKEEFFMLLMRANFLGQGTGGARIGLDKQEKFLTLSLGLPYELEYSSFKQYVEDFVNYLTYWREKIAEFEQGKTLV
ncbi:MAG: type III secretion system chaperone [Chlamydiales bacterium]|nr:type III secretion system chaperone [Chlamydiales bacterium]